jgi:dTDP-4-amino-4,6-dideoxygalactose transaminase
MKATSLSIDEPSTLFAPWPFFEPDEIEAALRVLQSGKINYWTGDEGRRFEEEYADYVGCKHAAAVANGTVALELALIALGVGPGHEVITTSRTFIASASCVVRVGATPVIADVDRDSQNVTADSIRPFLTPRTKAIIAVHLAGWPCDLDPILDLARESGIAVVEDCAQAHGATYKGRQVGSIGDVGAFSFCQDKIITTGGEGGMLTTKNSQLWEKAWEFKDHGKSYDAVYRRSHAPGFRWLHESFGTNWRLTEMQSAIGRVALSKLSKWVETRRAHASILNECLSSLAALRITTPPPEFKHSYYKYYAFVRPECLKSDWSRDRIMAEIQNRGVPCFSGSCSEIYREKAFQQSGWGSYSCEVARELGETSLMFLVHPTLTSADIERTCSVAHDVFQLATR